MKLYFHVDAIFEGKVIYEAGKTYDVDEANGWAFKWMKRGAQPIEDVLLPVGQSLDENASVELPEEKVDTVEDTATETKRYGKRHKSSAKSGEDFSKEL